LGTVKAPFGELIENKEKKLRILLPFDKLKDEICAVRIAATCYLQATAISTNYEVKI